MASWDGIVLGAGIAGLAAAYELCKQGKRVLVLEKSDQPGGALRASRVKTYLVDEYYHHVFPRDKRTIRICRELNVPIDWKYATTAFLDHERFYRLTTPQDLLTFKPLSFKNKLALGKLMLAIKFVTPQQYRAYDTVSAQEFLIKHSNRETYERFFRPLLQSKFGGDLSRISAAWIIERLRLRSERSMCGEKLGYVRGGFQQLTQALVRALESQRSKVVCNATIKNIRQNPQSWSVTYNKQTSYAQVLISTLPPKVLLAFVQFPEQYARVLHRLEYQGACCVLVGLDKPLTKYYWTNILQPASFGAVVEQTNFVSPRAYAGDHVVYLASYPDHTSVVWLMTEEQVAQHYLADLQRLFGKRTIRWHRVFRLPAAGLVYRTGIRQDIVPVTTPLKNLFVAGQFNSYPERSIDKSFELAEEITRRITTVSRAP